jgi:hypothetical protein
MTKRTVKVASSYRMFVCECGCGAVNLVLEDHKGKEFAVAQIHPHSILNEWVAAANQSLNEGPNTKRWDVPSGLMH